MESSADDVRMGRVTELSSLTLILDELKNQTTKFMPTKFKKIVYLSYIVENLRT